jgi:hypothetical protein
MPCDVQIKMQDLSICYRSERRMRVSKRQILPTSSKHI